MSKNVVGAILCNLLIVVLEVVALILNSNIDLYSYTSLANYLLCLFALLVAIFTFLKKQVYEIPVWIMYGKYVALISILVGTLFTLVVEIPLTYSMSGYLEGFKNLILAGNLFIYKLIVPAIGKISFIFFEGDRRLNKKKTMYYPLVFTVAYMIVTLVLVMNKIYVSTLNCILVNGLAIYYVAIIAIATLIVNYLIGRIVLYNNQKYAPRIKLKR